MSKTALNMAGKLLAEDLAAQQIPVGVVHPGPVSLVMTQASGSVCVKLLALTCFKCCKL
jgi:NAD(P)-dependent dehydrogenase (short-subunit alcohol dehydrogenase family)